MSDFDVYDDADPLPPGHLLDELESIKDILDDDGDDTAAGDIPLLDDMVIDNLDANTRLLNLNRIFDDSDGADAGPAPVEPARANVQFPRFSLDTLLPDEMQEPAAAPGACHQPSATAKRVRPDYSREVLIQELVDDFIPQIEAALRERLGQLDNATLQRWKEQK
jgi:hypothetical protein